MTDTVSRPTRPARPPSRSRAGSRPGLLRAGLPAAAWALGAGLVAVAVPVLLVWAADSRSGAGAGAAVAMVAQIWLLAHGTGIAATGGTIGLVPLGLFVLPLLLLERAARHAASQHEVTAIPDAARLAAGVAGPYALAVTVVAGLARSAHVEPAAAQALVGASVIALIGAGTGVLRGAQLGPALRAAIPTRIGGALAPAAAALLTLLGAGALLAGGSLALHLGEAADLAAASSPGVVGGFGLLLLGLLMVPTAAVWGACYLAGPGLAVGVGTAFGPFGVTTGPLPSVPLLAALPAAALPIGLGLLVLAIPLLAGVIAGRLAGRRNGRLSDALLAGPLAGVAFALLAVVSGGPLGGGHLSQVGPSGWRIGLAVAVEVSAGAASLAGVQRLCRRWQSRASSAAQPHA